MGRSLRQHTVRVLRAPIGLTGPEQPGVSTNMAAHGPRSPISTQIWAHRSDLGLAVRVLASSLLDGPQTYSVCSPCPGWTLCKVDVLALSPVWIGLTLWLVLMEPPALAAPWHVPPKQKSSSLSKDCSTDLLLVLHIPTHTMRRLWKNLISSSPSKSGSNTWKWASYCWHFFMSDRNKYNF